MNSASSRRFLLSFFLGCSIGIFSTIIYSGLLTHRSCTSTAFTSPPSRIEKLSSVSADTEKNADADVEAVDTNHPPLPLVVFKRSIGPIVFNDLDSMHQKDGDVIAKKLSQKIRILCWVLTSPKTLYVKGQAVKDTWGKRCNILVFFSSVADEKFPVVGLNVSEGRQNLWAKTRGAWKYIYDHHYEHADWFIKADDDTYLLVENLRYLVARYKTSDPHYFGRYFKPFGGYNSGGAGYVFSKATLRAFNRVMKDPSRCALKSGSEDVGVGKCLAVEGIYPGDTRDALGRETFHPFAPYRHLSPVKYSKDFWLHKYNKWKVATGPECCSKHTVAFHYVTPGWMYSLEYLIYHLHPYGVNHIH